MIGYLRLSYFFLNDEYRVGGPRKSASLDSKRIGPWKRHNHPP